jgi:hypothetical protein
VFSARGTIRRPIRNVIYNQMRRRHCMFRFPGDETGEANVATVCVGDRALFKFGEAQSAAVRPVIWSAFACRSPIRRAAITNSS